MNFIFARIVWISKPNSKMSDQLATCIVSDKNMILVLRILFRTTTSVYDCDTLVLVVLGFCQHNSLKDCLSTKNLSIE